MADPKDCRIRANLCIDLANSARDVRAQRIYFDMAQNWLNMAMALERTCGLLDDDEIVSPRQAS